jgi:putative transposase
MVHHPAAYLWSSHAVNSGRRSDPLIAPHPEFQALATEEEKRSTHYRALCEESLAAPLQQAIRDATNTGYPLASDAFKATVLAPRGWKLGPNKPGPRAMSPEGAYALES